MEKSLSSILEEYYPDLSWKDRYSVMWGATCFPFGNLSDWGRQLKELSENTDGSLESAREFAYKQMDEEYEKFKSTIQNQHSI